MRDPKRIDRILRLIRKYWQKNPDMRLGQVLINLSIAHDDFNYWITEDDEWEKFLKRKVK